jgi:hypothetical protein
VFVNPEGKPKQETTAKKGGFEDLKQSTKKMVKVLK